MLRLQLRFSCMKLPDREDKFLEPALAGSFFAKEAKSVHIPGKFDI